MSNLDEIMKFKAMVIDNTEKLYHTIMELQRENEQLRQRITKLETNGENGTSTIIENNTEANSKSSISAPSQPKTSSIPDEIPSLGPDSVDPTNLDELLANDALVSTVYHRLVPLKQLKYRLLAMQMGISIDRCKVALEKLERAGAVSIDDKEIVTLLRK